MDVCRSRKVCCAALAIVLGSMCICKGMAVSAKTDTLKLNYQKKTVQVKKTFRLKVTCSKKYQKKIQIKSSDRSVASAKNIGNGRIEVKAKKAGKARVTVTVRGTSLKAACQVTVKKAAGSRASAVPSGTASAATAAPGNVPAGEPTAAPAVPSQSPPAAAEPVQTQPAAVLADSSVLVVSRQVVTVDGTVMTAYVINKRYYGDITIKLDEKSYTARGSARNLILQLANSATEKENHDGTVRVFRDGLEAEYWQVEIKDEAGNILRTYNLKASRDNLVDPQWDDCGVIYVLGDVGSEVEIIGQDQSVEE